MSTRNFQANSQGIEFAAPDGYLLSGHCWQAQDILAPVVVINPATSVVSRYYSRFASYLNSRGFHVLTYDYRGIGLSRHGALKDLKAGWLDWGELDCEAAIQEAARRFPGSTLHAVGHSVGGVLVGLAPSNHLLARVFTMGAQHAYWPDYAKRQRWAMRLRWHLVMPALTRLLGYFPGKRLGWLEDTPAGVVRDWIAPYPDFVQTFSNGNGSKHLSPVQCNELRQRFAQVTAATLALSLTDDPFGTLPAIERLLANFTQSPKTHLRIEPSDVGFAQIGHFRFFHSRFEKTLWPIAWQWLEHGELDQRFCTRIVQKQA